MSESVPGVNVKPGQLTEEFGTGVVICVTEFVVYELASVMSQYPDWNVIA